MLWGSGVTLLILYEASNFKTKILPEKSDISLLKISICISVSAINIQGNPLVGGGDPEGVTVQNSQEAVL